MVTSSRKSNEAASDSLKGKDVDTRLAIAHRIGGLLSVDDLPPVEREAAASLARQLMNDAIERVRCALSEAVRRARYLPRDIAVKIAHDVDSVSCPFLETTDVFSDADWRQIILTVSRGALAAIAKRAQISEELALEIAKHCDSVVAEALVENSGAPMTAPVCNTLMERFASATWVLDKLAQRDDLFGDVAIKLAIMVSGAAREKLVRVYGLPDLTEPVIIEAEVTALLQIIRNSSGSRQPRLVQHLKQANRLNHSFILLAMRENLLAFVVAAMSDLNGMPLDEVRAILLHGSRERVIDLFAKGHMPVSLIDDLWAALSDARASKSGDAD